MEELLKDRDFRYFMRELRHTPIGERYYQALLGVHLAPIEIRILMGLVRLKRISPAQADPQIAEWRRRYIRYCHFASATLEELTETYYWPIEDAVLARPLTAAMREALIKQGWNVDDSFPSNPSP